MSFRQWLLTFVLLLTIPIMVSAQGELYSMVYDKRAGLSHNTVFCVFQDSQGFIWLGTKNGLNRFDGIAFKTFLRTENPIGLCNSIVNAISEDTEKRLWVGTDKGISIYDMHHGCFVDFRLKGLDGESGSYISDLQLGRGGKMWIQSSCGLFWYDLKRGKLHKVPAPRAAGLPMAISLDYLGNCYVGYRDFGIAYYDGSTLRTVTRGITDPTTICPFGPGHLLVGTKKGAFDVELSSGMVRDINALNPALNIHVNVHTVCEVSEMEHWIGTEVGVFVVKRGRVTHFASQGTCPALPDDAVYAICRDHSGGMWIGTYFGGVDYIVLEKGDVINHSSRSMSNPFPAKRVRDFIEDDNHRLWVATEDAGLFVRETPSGFFRKVDKLGSFDVRNINIQCLFLSDGCLLVGTFGRGLYVWDLSTGRTSHYDSDFTDEDIFSVYRDRRGNLWVGTSTGLYLFNPRKGRLFKVRAMDSAFVSVILEGHDKQGYVWFGTYNIGIVRYNPVTHQFKVYKYQKGNAASPGGDRATCALVTSRGRLWFGFEDGGLCWYDSKHDCFRRVNQHDGVPGNSVYKILEDGRRTLWLSTNIGIVSFNPATMQSLAVYDGGSVGSALQFNYNAGIQLSSGNMLLGSTEGFVEFNPYSMRKRTQHGRVLLTGLMVDGRELEWDSLSCALDYAFPYTRQVTLQHGQSTFSVTFSTLTFRARERGMFSYMLEGFDNKWNYCLGEHSVSYHNVPSGLYHFRIRQVSDMYDDNAPETTLTIRVLRPWYMSTVAMACYVLLILLLGLGVRWLINRRRNEHRATERLKTENAKREEAYEARIKSFILMMSDGVPRDKTDEEFFGKLLQEILRNIEDEDFNIDQLASAMNMSRSNLHRRVKAVTGQTPNDFVRLVRLRRAAELLRSGRHRVKEVCMMVGFHSLSYFSKAFCKQFGVLPKDFVRMPDSSQEENKE